MDQPGWYMNEVASDRVNRLDAGFAELQPYLTGEDIQAGLIRAVVMPTGAALRLQVREARPQRSGDNRFLAGDPGARSPRAPSWCWGYSESPVSWACCLLLR